MPLGTNNKGHLIIPTRYIGTGNISIAKIFIGQGKKLLHDLQKSLSFQNPPLQTGKSGPFNFPGGVSITCEVCYGENKVYIDVKSKFNLKLNKRLCPSFKCFSIGYIIRESLEVDMLSPERRYDIELCSNNKERYIFIENCRTSDFATYTIGEQVLVSTKWNNLPCCINPPIEIFLGYVITPLITAYKRWIDA